jgi:CRISPR-associated protein Csx3
MSNFNIEMTRDASGDLLQVGFGEPATGDKIVQEISLKLREMISSKQIRGGELLRINGMQSVAAAYTFAHGVAHLYGAIAVFDPKIEGNGYDGYIVVISHNPDYPVGKVLKYQNDFLDAIKIALCGPPQSGKSVFREALKTAIFQMGGFIPYIITGCPDGEGAWFQAAAANDSQRARQLKDINKEQMGGFTLKFAENIAKGVSNVNLLVSLIDCGGKMSPENSLILKEATHAIVVAGDQQDDNNKKVVGNYKNSLEDWSKFCESFGIKVISKIYSDLHGTEDHFELREEILTGSIHNLSRGANVSDRPMVQAIAEQIINLVNLRIENSEANQIPPSLTLNIS